MPLLQWSLWDELNIGYPPPSDAHWRSNPGAQACDQRTAFLATDPNAAAEAERRRAAWIELLQRKLSARPEPHTETEDSSPMLDIVGAGPSSIVSTMIAVAVLGLFGSLWRGFLLLIPAIGLIAFFAIRWNREQQWRRFYRILMTNSCGRCRYAFGDIAPEKLRACPECGEPWPLIPPPPELAR